MPGASGKVVPALKRLSIHLLILVSWKFTVRGGDSVDGYADFET